jgi:hypothetical protein
MVAVQVNVDLFEIMICKPAAAQRLGVGQGNAALLEIQICKQHVVRVRIQEAALPAAPLVNVVLFKTLTDKPTAAPRQAEAKANVDSSVTTTCRRCVALKPAVAQVSVDLSETPICKLPVARKQDKTFIIIGDIT